MKKSLGFNLKIWSLEGDSPSYVRTITSSHAPTPTPDRRVHPPLFTNELDLSLSSFVQVYQGC